MGDDITSGAGGMAARTRTLPLQAIELIELIGELSRRAVRRARASLDPRDLSQEVILSLLERDSGLATPAHVAAPPAYYTVMVRNGLVRQLRRDAQAKALKDRVEMELDSVAPEPEGSPEEIAVFRLSARRRLTKLLRRLRPCDRRALLLLLELGWSTQDVAVRLKTSVNHVHQMRHRIQAAAEGVSARAGARCKPDSD